MNEMIKTINKTNNASNNFFNVAEICTTIMKKYPDITSKDFKNASIARVLLVHFTKNMQYKKYLGHIIKLNSYTLFIPDFSCKNITEKPNAILRVFKVSPKSLELYNNDIWDYYMPNVEFPSIPKDSNFGLKIKEIRKKFK